MSGLIDFLLTKNIMLGTDYIADVYYDAAYNEKHRELLQERREQ